MLSMIFFIVLSIYFFIKAWLNTKYLFLWGISLGLALISKYIALYLIPVYFIFMNRFLKGGPPKGPEDREAYFEKVKSLGRYLENLAEEKRTDGIPVDSQMRIDIDAYVEAGVYPQSEVDNDRRIVNGWIESFPGNEGRSLGDIRDEEHKTDGIQLEMLATAVLDKAFGGRVIVMRTAEYDDLKKTRGEDRYSGADNILVDMETGHVICAIDEVGDVSGEPYKKHKENVRKKNLAGGIELKYGVELDIKSGKLDLSALSGLPALVLALPKDMIRAGIESFEPQSESLDSTNKKTLLYFLSALGKEIADLKDDNIYNVRGKPDFKAKVDDIEKFLEAELNKLNK